MFGETFLRVSRAARARAGFLALSISLASIAHAAATSRPVQIKDHLYGVAYVTERLGWVVGAFGTIYQTRDGGDTWAAQLSHTTQQLYDVDFVDEQNGWIVGRSGTLLHTADGGQTWTPQDAGTDKHLFAVDFADREVGVAVGDWGTIVTTADGGRTWVSRTLENDVILNDVSLVDRSTGWIAGELGTILATTDGGVTWNGLVSGVDKTLFGVHFVDAERGWAVGIDALMLRTTDGGRTWEVQNGSTEVRALEQVGFSQAYDNPSLYSVAVAGETGVAAGEIGAVFLSHDGGQTWTRAATVAGVKSGWYRDVSVVSGTHGAIVGGEGKRMLIVDGRLQSPRGVESAAEEVH